MKPTKQTVYLPKSTFPLSMKGKVDDLFCLQQGYFFTPEQLNEYTQNVIKQALETAAEKAEPDYWKGSCELCGSNTVDKESIINTFEETYNKFEV
jgi:hypothetical protein